MILDLSRGTFAAGQLYVALSRVRTLGGLYLTRPVKASDFRKDDEVMAFTANFNNDSVIEQQLAEGKALYPYLKSCDYDGAVAQYMQLAKDILLKGDHRTASILFKKMMNIMIADDVLTDSCRDIPLNENNNCVAWFNNSIICLYGGNPELAVKYADKVLATRTVYESMYIKARALYKMGRTDLADEVNVEMSRFLNQEGGKGYDAKFICSLAQVNEAIGDPSLGGYQEVVLRHPEYIQGQVKFFMAMKRQHMKLVLAEDHELPALAILFNGAQSVDEFVESLKTIIAEDKEELAKFIDTVRKQILE
jgi:hypothetical protein